MATSCSLVVDPHLLEPRRRGLLNWIDRLIGGTRARILRGLRRAPHTISELSEGEGISGNAVRGHVVLLQNDGLVRQAGTAPSTGGKPAHLYALTREGEELFPKAYTQVLAELIRSLRDRDGDDQTVAILDRVGRRLAGGTLGTGTMESRMQTAADILRSMGGEVEVLEDGDGWSVQGFGCPLSGLVTDEPDACAIAQGLIAEVTGADVHERCERGAEGARCRFRLVRAL